MESVQVGHLNITPEDYADDFIRRAAEPRKFGVFNDKLLVACALRYLELRDKSPKKKAPHRTLPVTPDPNATPDEAPYVA